MSCDQRERDHSEFILYAVRMALKFLKNLFTGDSNEKVLLEMNQVVDEVETYGKSLGNLTDQELQEKSKVLKNKLLRSDDPPKELDLSIVEALGLIRESITRTTGETAYGVQIKGALALHRGQVAEMRTGEGKTLVATLALYINSLIAKGVHSVTVNDYLARRDSQWYAPALDLLGISIGVIQNDRSAWIYSREILSSRPTYEHLREVTRPEAYQADIVYGTNNEFGFDYLRDNMATTLADSSQGQLDFAIVDEADSILIDEARTPLIISGAAQDDVSLYPRFSKIVPLLQAERDYTVDLQHRSISLTENGIEILEKALGISNIYAPENFRMTRYLEAALKAEVLFKKDRDYVVSEGQVVIVDDFTGRLMEGRRWSDGLHQAVEAKEKVKIQQESITYATITIQNYFRLYKKLAGMTGTAITEAEEFNEIYNLEVLVIPPNRDVAREDYPDLVFRNQSDKWSSVITDVHEKHQVQRPVLVGTVSIETSEGLSQQLTKLNIPHEVLNAKQHQKEAEIIEKAGALGAVTIATNMAGRGTDIKLSDEVKRLGGLHVIGTERHEARRIDNQLRGRCGRQGDPGSTRFFVSFEDEMVKRFSPDWLSGMIDKLVDDGEPLESKQLTSAIGQAQQKVESYNFDIRKHLVKYDDVTNSQRAVVYEQRNLVLQGEHVKETVIEMVHGEIDSLALQHLINVDYDFELFRQSIEQITGDLETKDLNNSDNQKSAELIEEAKHLANSRLEILDNEFGEELRRRTEELILISAIDATWVEHLTALSELRQGIGLRAYAQTDPLVAFQREAHDMWDQYRERVQNTVARQILRARIIVNEPSRIQPRPNHQITANEVQSSTADDVVSASTGGTRAERRRLERQQKKINKVRNEKASAN